ncbi:MAG TPA: DinB family protein [Ktedonobacterales bacterium]|nr:DinB family protein [Ktedonobacterales bacterium]
MADTENTEDTYTLALGILAGTSACLRAMLEQLPPDIWQWSPAAGEWSPRQVLDHMLQVETAVIPVRVRRMIEEDGAPLAGVAQTSIPAAPAEVLKAWLAAREQNLSYLHTLTPPQLAQGGEHPRYGRISAREHIIEWAYHDLEHMRQLQATLEARLYPAIGGFRALYSKPYPEGNPSA